MSPCFVHDHPQASRSGTDSGLQATGYRLQASLQTAGRPSTTSACEVPCTSVPYLYPALWGRRLSTFTPFAILFISSLFVAVRLRVGYSTRRPRFVFMVHSRFHPIHSSSPPLHQTLDEMQSFCSGWHWFNPAYFKLVFSFRTVQQIIIMRHLASSLMNRQVPVLMTVESVRSVRWWIDDW